MTAFSSCEESLRHSTSVDQSFPARSHHPNNSIPPSRAIPIPYRPPSGHPHMQPEPFPILSLPEPRKKIAHLMTAKKRIPTICTATPPHAIPPSIPPPTPTSMEL
ncbi:hypothetical protein K402DRAFT_397899 [Aulographum hederae CBS 113979]|uniref:Uncharacterized protein n=1 Tax=Aulographum hederae CBS 113979 TaxID=1176131 RepID=A0A6G1GMH0_9PEZI|nr:hypothetical protein K402DRAFT_397899 [Aulographum hederae CBS 113979]